MYRVSFVDGFCPRPYDAGSLMTEPMGGTESAITLLSEALSKYVTVEVLQHCRTSPIISANGVLYRGVKNWRAEASRQRQGVTIIINSPKLLALWRKRNKSSTLVLWRHNYLGNRHKKMVRLLKQLNATMVCVSEHHLSHSIDHIIESDSQQQRRRLYAIANPVQVYVPTNASINPDKLLFCSSPHKGLNQCLELFDSVRQSIPSLKLSICNPGYLPDALIRQCSVKVLGSLNRPDLHRHMAESLCVFYPQTQFSETFGLVAAESNLLGTPVLAPAGLGALSEVVSDQRQLLQVTDSDSLVETLRAWRSEGAPLVTGLKRFDPDTVASQWYTLINGLITNKALPSTEISQTLIPQS